MRKQALSIIAAICLMITNTAYHTPTAYAEELPVTEAVTDQQDTPVEVGDYADFANAVLNAQDGATLIITGVVEIPASYEHPDTGKHLTALNGSIEARIIFEVADAPQSEFANFTFDGGNTLSDYPFVTISHSREFKNVSFINCAQRGNGGAVNVTRSNVSFVDCTFDGNTAEINGGHLYVWSGANVTLDGCVLINGHATASGGAIRNDGTCSIASTVITGNTTDGAGGGISTTAAMTITSSKVYDNTATQGGADIANGLWGNLTLNDDFETLTSNFAVDGLVPVGWVYDYPTAPITTPVTLDQMNTPQYTPLKMAFQPSVTPTEPATPTPTPSERIVYYPVYIEVTPAPTPIPTPEPTAEPTATPTSEPTPEPKDEPAPTVAPLLVCGDAVIDVSRREYLSGYADSHAGNDAPVTRAQAAQVIYRLLTDDSRQRVYSQTGGFSDVGRGDWFNTFVATLHNSGVVSGCGNGLFLPNKALTRGEMLTLFTNFVQPRTDRHIQIEHWSSGAIQTAASLGWIDYGDGFNPDDEIGVQEFIQFTQTVLNWGTP